VRLCEAKASDGKRTQAKRSVAGFFGVQRRWVVDLVVACFVLRKLGGPGWVWCEMGSRTMDRREVPGDREGDVGNEMMRT
jgi:hypothetical protein